MRHWLPWLLPTATASILLTAACGEPATGSDGLGGAPTSGSGGASSSGGVTGQTGGVAGSTGGASSGGAPSTGGEAATGGSATGGNGTGGSPEPEPPRTRVVGYMPNWYGSYTEWAGRVDFGKLTHVNLAFALGDDDGDLELAPNSQVDAFVTAAHAAGVLVFPSLCGGGGDGRIAPHYEPDKVDGFVAKIVKYALDRHMDGIDVDVEAPNRMGAKYNTFIAKLIAAAHPHGLEVTAAVAPWMQSGMSDATLRSFDYITVMSYDNAGTWTQAGAHSSYQQAVDALNFYENKGVAKDKIVLGVPFYGYCWGSCGDGQTTRYILYKDIVSRFNWAPTTDWIDQGGAKYSYNGTATMARKTELGKEYGGIMIWELAGDLTSTNANSLLKAIDDAL